MYNDRLLKSLAQQPVDRTPVWIMRQAGRYLPEYRKTRSKVKEFMDVCTNPSLALEVTMQPLARFPLDAAILFSDILTIPDAMGCGLYFEDGIGPKFRFPIQTRTAIDSLELPDPAALNYVSEAIELVCAELSNKIPLIGFSGSPWTLATYMIEGGTSKDHKKVRSFVYQDPEALEVLLEKLSIAVTDALNQQIRAGIQVVQIFDSWAGLLCPHLFKRLSLKYLRRIISGLELSPLGDRIPVIIFARGAGESLEELADIGGDCLGIDWSMDLGRCKKRVLGKVALQGNMDPLALNGTVECIQSEVKRICSLFKGQPGHIFNLGHGIEPDIDPDKVSVMIEAVERESRKILSFGQGQ